MQNAESSCRSGTVAALSWLQGRAIVLMSAPSRDGEISMNEEQLQKIGQSLQDILAELRAINAREERRDHKSSAVQDRFANL